ncbi:MAG: DUF3307 domain-containing protein [Suipraeoptans sp.]
MYIDILLLFLLGHVVGDFYLQFSKMAINKEKSIKWVMIHCVVYTIGMLVLGTITYSSGILLYVLLVTVLHFLVDVAKYKFVVEYTKKRELTGHIDRNIFFVDQLLHFISIAMVSYFVVRNGVVTENAIFTDIFATIGIKFETVIVWTFAILIIHKPTNIAISKLLTPYKPNGEVEERTDNKAGRFVGTIERIIMLIFLSIGQYSAIGLVLTAKSIARYDRISKEPEFAEYYLLGTLLSTLAAIIVSITL